MDESHDAACVSQPLIHDGRPPVHRLAESSVTRANAFLRILTATAGVGGLLFGYDTGVISATLVSIHNDLGHPLTSLDKSLITAATSLFALLASPLSSILADRWGRRSVILAASLLFVAGSVVQAGSSSVALMILGRAIVGAAVGSASFAVPLYISELAPANLRGRLVTVSSLFVTGGQVVAYVVGWALADRAAGWRWMVGLGALPAVLQLALLGNLPETPRWLVRAGRDDAAVAVLTRVYESDSIVRDVLARMHESISAEQENATASSTLRDLTRVPTNRRALVIACILQGAQQLCGFNSLLYFSATIFALVGFTQPTLPSLTVACTNFVLTVVAFHLIDRVGQRRILLWSMPFMAAGMLLAAWAFANMDVRLDDSPSPSQDQSDPTWPRVLLFATTIYVSAYAIGLGCVPWQQSELFPLRVRALGSGIATATNWGANTLVGFTFLPLMQLISPSGAFVVYGAVCIAAWVLVRRIYPETAGMSLEQVRGLLEDGFNVEESIARWKDRSR